MVYNKEQKKEYYEKNKEVLLSKAKLIEKVKCECGEIMGKYKLPKHKTTWTHHYFNGTLEHYNSF